MLKIGSLKLKSNILLAPMAGITDIPFRMLCRKFGCATAFVEMINVRSLSHNSPKTKSMLSSGAQDHPLGVQILGCEPKFILKGLDILRGYKFDLLDFNAACPVKKVVRRGEGAALLCQPDKFSSLLKLIVQNSSLPVTVKIRTGWDKDSVNAREIALFAQDAGASAVFIHGRTRVQGYSGGVDYKAISHVKKALDIPVIGSGDIYSAESAQKMFTQTGCDGICVARGALGNPWIFKELTAFFERGKILPGPDVKERVKVMITHVDMYVDFYGERTGVVLFRKFFSWYTKGLRHIRPLREKVSRAKTKKDLLALIGECQAFAVSHAWEREKGFAREEPLSL